MNARFGGTARLMKLGLPITTFILMFSIGDMFRRLIPKSGAAVILTLFAADLIGAILVAASATESNLLKEGDRLILMAGALLSVMLGIFIASYF
ncbi:hypothetical protein ACVBGC_32620 [Burkholderia stagnalis]